MELDKGRINLICDFIGFPRGSGVSIHLQYSIFLRPDISETRYFWDLIFLRPDISVTQYFWDPIFLNPIFLWLNISYKFLDRSLRVVHTNFHAKSRVCSSKNGRVIALGTKEDTIIISMDYTVQTFLFKVQKFGQKRGTPFDLFLYR